MSLSACKVSVELLVQAKSASTVILPSCVPTAVPPVETVRPVVAKALVKVVALMTVSSWLATKPLPVPVAFEITTL